MRRVGVVLVAMALGCATTYKHGARDTEVSPGIHRIEVEGGVATPLATLEKYFHWRASEICAAKGIDAYDFRLDGGFQSRPIPESGDTKYTSPVAAALGGVGKVLEVVASARTGWVVGAIVCVPDGPKKVKLPPAEPPPTATPPDAMQAPRRSRPYYR